MRESESCHRFISNKQRSNKAVFIDLPRMVNGKNKSRIKDFALLVSI